MGAPILAADADIAQALMVARAGGPLVDAATCDIANLDQAYRIQALVMKHLEPDRTGAMRHWKSGGASRLTTPTHAPLPCAGVWRSPAQAGQWPFRLRGVEAEIALRLKQPVDAARIGHLGASQVVDLIDAMAVSIELVDSRWRQGFQVPAHHKLADHQLHGALVLGPWQPFVLRDWSSQRGEVRVGAQVIPFTGSHPLGDPTWLLSDWLRHATRDHGVLPEGAVVTTGTWCGLPMALPGDEVVAVFDGLGEARVQL